MASGTITAWQMEREKVEVVSDRFPLGLQNHCGWWLQPWNQKMTASWQERDDKPGQCVAKPRHDSADKGLYSQSYSLSSDHVQLWELDRNKGRMPKNWCLWTVVLEKTPLSPLDSKEIKPVNLNGDQPWIFTERTDTEAEALVFWSSDVNRWLIGKVPDAGKDWVQKEKRESGDEMVEQHYYWCNEHELEETLGVAEGQGGCHVESVISQKVRHSWMTEQQHCTS